MRVLDKTGAAEEASDSEVTIQGMIADGGKYDDELAFVWRTYRGSTGWFAGRNLAELKTKPAQAWCVNNMTGDKVYFQMSGGVELTPVTEEIGIGYGLLGNMTPNTIKLQDIKVYSGDELNADDSLVTIQGMIASSGKYDDEKAFVWRTYRGSTGWFAGRNLADIDVLPGEAFCLNNMTAGKITLKFKSPIAPTPAE